MRREDAYALAVKHMPKEAKGWPSDWVLDAVAEAYRRGKQEGASQGYFNGFEAGKGTYFDHGGY